MLICLLSCIDVQSFTSWKAFTTFIAKLLIHETGLSNLNIPDVSTNRQYIVHHANLKELINRFLAPTDMNS